jgi:hypothetical protein
MTIHRRNHGRGHSYWDGEGEAAVKLPGVTTIVRECNPLSGGLRNWPAKVTARYAVDHWDTLAGLLPTQRLDLLMGAQNQERSRVTRQGSAIHRIGEQLANAGEDEPVEVPEELLGYAESYRDFLDAYAMKTIAVELVVANRAVGYCGTLDVIGDLPELSWDGGLIPAARWLLDLKSGASGIWPETAIQTVAYANAEVWLDDHGDEHPMTAMGIERCGAVHVRSDGWELVPLDSGPAVFDYFKHLAWLWYQADSVKTWAGLAADPPAAAAAPF